MGSTGRLDSRPVAATAATRLGLLDARAPDGVGSNSNAATADIPGSRHRDTIAPTSPDCRTRSCAATSTYSDATTTNRPNATPTPSSPSGHPTSRCYGATSCPTRTGVPTGRDHAGGITTAGS